MSGMKGKALTISLITGLASGLAWAQDEVVVTQPATKSVTVTSPTTGQTTSVTTSPTTGTTSVTTAPAGTVTTGGTVVTTPTVRQVIVTPVPAAKEVVVVPTGYANCFTVASGWFNDEWIPQHQICQYENSPEGASWIEGYWACTAYKISEGTCTNWDWKPGHWAKTLVVY